MGASICRSWAAGRVAQSPRIAAPAVWGNTVYFGSTDGGLYGVSLRRGALQWRFDTGSAIIGSPTIVNGVIYFGAADHTLYALPT